MGKAQPVGPLDTTVGYLLKQAEATIRGEMDAVLRPMDLSVPQYACLELLHQHAELSNAELARAAFVTRQSMNLVLRGLEDRGLVTRPDIAATGRARAAELTGSGRTLHARASVAVNEIERRMVTGLSRDDERRLVTALQACIANLVAPAVPVGDSGPASSGAA